ncbi:MAG: 2-alkenal reductase [Elusimicrobia bacterium GWA2_69_24]|nr:MAG: 2-alkenal reductase [Elusimicrobia bacterium GWA2_69_24]
MNPPRTAVLLALLLAAAPAAPALARKSLADASRKPAPRGALGAEEQAVIKLFRDAKASVVFITTLNLQRDAFSFNVLEIPRGAGSGFVWDETGLIVTNFHVILDADEAVVTLSDRSTWKAKLVGVAADKDLAVLKISAPADKLKALPLGTSHDLQVGQQVLAIGNPFGLDQTLTTGVISALGREIQSLTGRPILGAIQTDAAINPGNSGGPLLDSAGRLIGVNTQIYSPSGAYAGVGFAVPVDTVRRIVPQLISKGKVTRPGMGISVAEDYLAEQMGIRGALIIGVDRRSAAEQARLRGTRRDVLGRLVLGDVITALNGKPVASTDDMFRLLEEAEVGDEVVLTLQRDGRAETVRLRLQPVD